MGDGTKENPLTREDVLKKIEENGGTAKGLDLSNRKFVEAVNLAGLNLAGIILDGAEFPPKPEFADAENPNLVTKLTGANLREADLSFASLNSTYLWQAQLQKTKFYYCKMQKVFLAQTDLQEADLSFCELQGANFEASNLCSADLHGADFNNDTKFALIHWGDYVLREEKNSLFLWAEETYRKLKMWYTNSGMYNIAGEFLFREMTVKRKKLKWWPNPLPRAWSKLLSILCGYGERPLRVVRWGISAIFGLALLYFFLCGVAPYTLTVQSFLNSLYYSTVSFTALGYGPWFSASSVRGWTQGVGAAEAIIGVFTMALFLITFVRKMTR